MSDCHDAAKAALTSFIEQPGHDQYEDDEINIVDLISDLLLYAESEGLDGDQVIERAMVHFAAERTT